MKDIKWLSKLLFEKSNKISVEEGEERLSKLINYFKDVLNISKASRIEGGKHTDKIPFKV